MTAEYAFDIEPQEQVTSDTVIFFNNPFVTFRRMLSAGVFLWPQSHNFTKIRISCSFDLRQHNAQFFILATDGLWDVMTNQEAISLVLQEQTVLENVHVPNEGGLDRELSIARKLVRIALDRGSMDNITVMIVNIAKALVGYAASTEEKASNLGVSNVNRSRSSNLLESSKMD